MADCPHKNKHLKVVATACGCETVQTICDDCKEVLKTQTDC